VIDLSAIGRFLLRWSGWLALFLRRSDPNCVLLLRPRRNLRATVCEVGATMSMIPRQHHASYHAVDTSTRADAPLNSKIATSGFRVTDLVETLRIVSVKRGSVHRGSGATSARTAANIMRHLMRLTLLPPHFEGGAMQSEPARYGTHKAIPLGKSTNQKSVRLRPVRSVLLRLLPILRPMISRVTLGGGLTRPCSPQSGRGCP
jgi:hypothetical protein